MNSKSIVSMFIIFLSVFTVGYAFLGTNIDIEGTTSIKSSKWGVHLDNIKLNSNSASSALPVIDSLNEVSITYTFSLSQPGDYYEFMVDIVNDGTLDAMIDSIDNKIYEVGNNENKLTNLPSYLKYTFTYSDDSSIIKNQLLRVGDTKTYKVRVEYLKDINNEDLPNKDINLKFKSNINYVQADDNAI